MRSSDGEEQAMDFAAEIEAFLASFSPEETTVMRHAFRAILEGAPASLADVQAASGLPDPVVEEAVRRLLERGTLVMEDGRLTGSRGLSLTETPHRLVLAGARATPSALWMRSGSRSRSGSTPRSTRAAITAVVRSAWRPGAA